MAVGARTPADLIIAVALVYQPAAAGFCFDRTVGVPDVFAEISLAGLVADGEVSYLYGAEVALHKIPFGARLYVHVPYLGDMSRAGAVEPHGDINIVHKCLSRYRQRSRQQEQSRYENPSFHQVVFLFPDIACLR